MKNRVAVCFFSLFLFMGIAFSAFAQSELLDVQKGVVKFSEDISKALPFNSLIGLNWSDAYIGKVYPDSPAHFGAGISLGATTMDPSSIETLASSLGTDFSLGMAKMPIPAYAVEGRLGGFSLPFDIGFKVGYLPPMGLLGDINLNYLLVGGDIRYAVLDGVANKALPNVSVGVGVNYLKGGIGGKMGDAQSIPFRGGTINLSQPNVNLEWGTTTLELKAQISKAFFIVTPYFGVGGNYSFSNAGYSVDANVTVNGRPVTQADIVNINNYLAENGYDPVDIDINGISSIIKKNAFNVRAFGGISLNLAAFRLDLTGLFNFLDQNYGATLGLRFQL